LGVPFSEDLTREQNYGIIIAFGMAFFLALLFFTEYNTHIPGEKSITLFKRGARALALRETQGKAAATDEEKGAIRSRGSAEKVQSDNGDSIQVPMMSDIFTWRHMEYNVSVGKGETRRLLDDISGFVAPGKLTALMGESGAGKVRMNETMTRNCTHTFFQTTLLNVLADRQAAGNVRGERLVNGYSLPSDFEAQTYVQATLFLCGPIFTCWAVVVVTCNRWTPTWPKPLCGRLYFSPQNCASRLRYLSMKRKHSKWSLFIKSEKVYRAVSSVETVLKMCGLERYADAIVGTLGVEHRKRTTIGVELAAKVRETTFRPALADNDTDSFPA
jgi:ATP-binding cassette subfamily G (WHITE) protein 2 (SNQ2)